MVMIFQLTCTYCGFIWQKGFYNESALKSTACVKCKDRHIRARNLDDARIDSYIGCPDFPEEKPSQKTEEPVKEKESERMGTLEEMLYDLYKNTSY